MMKEDIISQIDLEVLTKILIVLNVFIMDLETICYGMCHGTTNQSFWACLEAVADDPDECGRSLHKLKGCKQPLFALIEPR